MVRYARSFLYEFSTPWPLPLNLPQPGHVPSVARCYDPPVGAGRVKWWLDPNYVQMSATGSGPAPSSGGGGTGGPWLLLCLVSVLALASALVYCWSLTSRSRRRRRRPFDQQPPEHHCSDVVVVGSDGALPQAQKYQRWFERAFPMMSLRLTMLV